MKRRSKDEADLERLKDDRLRWLKGLIQELAVPDDERFPLSFQHGLATLWEYAGGSDDPWKWLDKARLRRRR